MKYKKINDDKNHFNRNLLIDEDQIKSTNFFSILFNDLIKPFQLTCFREQNNSNNQNYLLHIFIIYQYSNYKLQLFESTRASNYINQQLKSDQLMHALVFKSYDLNEYKKYDEDLLYRPYLEKEKENNILKLLEMQRSATQNQLTSSTSNSTINQQQQINEWPNKNWLSTSGKLSSLTFYQMLHSSLSNLSINAFNYKLELANFQLLKVEPSELAAQMSIYDSRLFRAITIEEILGFGWNGPRKSILAPGIANYIKRFNQISFWTMNEILLATFKHNPKFKNSNLNSSFVTLNENDNIKCRSTVVTYFIKLAKKLFLLNNILSCYAIISALRSASIHRLDQTWEQISKKDKKTFDELCKLFSDDDNYENLREHQKTVRGSCIPYLGLYFKDLIYLDTAYPKQKTSTNYQRELKIREMAQQILDFLSPTHFDNLVVNKTIFSYLQSITYIEELQKFMEEDYYKISLKLEKPKKRQDSLSSKLIDNKQESFNKSTFYISQNEITDIIEQPHTSRQLKYLPLNNDFNIKPNSNSFSFNQLKQNTIAGTKFKPSHRKSLSLGANVILSNHGGSYSSLLTKYQQHSSSNQQQLNQNKPKVINYQNHYLIDDAIVEENSDLTSLYKEKLKFNKLPSSTNSINSSTQICNGNHLEDSEHHTINSELTSSLDQSLKTTSTATATTTESLNNQIETDRTDESDSNSLILTKTTLNNIKYQGYLKRKTVCKDGRKPTLSTWIRYWVVLNSTSLVFYSSKSLRGCSRSHFKSTPSKCISLRSSLLNCKMDEQTPSMDTFIIYDNNETIYKFKTTTQLEAITWVREIASLIKNQTSFDF